MSHAFQRGQIRRRNVYTHSSSATPLSLTEEQSGSLIFLDCGTNGSLVVNLPPIAGSAGLNYEFLISNSLAGKEIKIHAAEATLKIKQWASLLGYKVVTIDNGEGTIGDKFEVVSDGSYWYLNQTDGWLNVTTGAE
jgi:hypothetical protein